MRIVHTKSNFTRKHHFSSQMFPNQTRSALNGLIQSFSGPDSQLLEKLACLLGSLGRHGCFSLKKNLLVLPIFHNGTQEVRQPAHQCACETLLLSKDDFRNTGSGGILEVRISFTPQI